MADSSADTYSNNGTVVSVNPEVVDFDSNFAVADAGNGKTTVKFAASPSVTGALVALNATATTAGGATTPGVKLGTAGLGIYFGSGAPTISAAQGSLYLRTDGSSTSTRLYVNTNGSTTWTNVTTAA